MTGSLRTRAVVAPDDDPAVAILSDNDTEREARVFNAGSVTVFYGDAGVTAATGLPLYPGDTLIVRSRGSLYGITASGTASLRVAEVE